MIKVAVHGATGRMGQLVVARLASLSDLRLVATPSRTDRTLGDADVVVDFSTPEALADLLPCLDGAALVSGTTGLGTALEARLHEASAESAVLHAPNFSAGIAVLRVLARQAGAMLPDWDVQICETHHTGKRDAPSGTALLLSEAVRPSGSVGIHAMRLSDVVGEHDVWLGGPGERIRLGHVATSRTVFADGALRAARWIAHRRAGRYHFGDVFAA